MLRSGNSEDILQDVFIKVWRNLNSFRSDMKFSSWIYRIVHNETISYWRKTRRYLQTSFSEGEKQFSTVDKHSYNQWQNEDSGRKEVQVKSDIPNILAHIQNLPQKYKDVMILKFIENMSYQEISDISKNS